VRDYDFINDVIRLCLNETDSDINKQAAVDTNNYDLNNIVLIYLADLSKYNFMFFSFCFVNITLCFFLFGHIKWRINRMYMIVFLLFLTNMFRFLFSPFFIIHYLDLGDCLTLTCEMCCCFDNVIKK
jgi:hypothetical protein